MFFEDNSKDLEQFQIIHNLNHNNKLSGQKSQSHEKQVSQLGMAVSLIVYFMDIVW